jgi:hypothetical protein
MSAIRADIHNKIYLAGLALLGISLPVSLFMMSVSELLLSANWVLEGNFKKKLQILKQRKSLLLIISIYLLHAIGLLYSNDFQYALHDLRIKLPFLALPIIIGTSEQLSGKQIKYILLLFISTVIVSSFISTAILFDLTKIEVNDIREISPFISHIRFALLVNMAIFSLLYYIFFNTSNKSYLRGKVIYIIAAIWLIIFLFLLQSFTGILIFIIITPFIIIVWAIKQKNPISKTTVILALIAGLSLITLYIAMSVRKFYSVEEIDPKNIDKYTVNGNKYFHDFNYKVLENGNYVRIYICEKELRNEWNKRSEYDYDGKDKKGQNINQTLIRYLTSKGLRKDSAGVSKLTKEDIRLIENGYSNYIFKSKLGIYPRIYQIIWEIDTYKKLGNPSGHSITQRFEFQKNAIQIIKKHFWIGVGTGDVLQAFNIQYNISNSPLAKRWRLKAHNQLITFFLTFGVFGFIWIMFSLIYPIFYEKKHRSLLFIIFFMIALFSMLNEDTLETHAGISFFSYFYALLLLGHKNE